MLTYEQFCDFIKEPYIITLDNNVLLDLYRNPPAISKDLLQLFDTISDALWITHQVYTEFLKNYEKIRGTEKKKYHKVQTELKTVIKKAEREINGLIKEYQRYNYSDVTELKNNVSTQILTINNIADEYIEKHGQEIDENINYLDRDEVKQFLNKLFTKGRIGINISFSERLSILREGKIRYANFLPPGYEDSDKSGMDKYGDLFVWKELISAANNKSRNVIFVTNDTKEDWWEKDKSDNLLCARKELVQEFEENTLNKKIEFLTLNTFYEHMTRLLHILSLNTLLNLEIDSYITYFNSKKVATDTVENKLNEISEKLELSEYIPEEFSASEFVWSDWEILSGFVEIQENYAIYIFEVEGYSDYKISFEDNEGNSFDIGELNVEFTGNIQLKRIIAEDYKCSDDFEICDIVFDVETSNFKGLCELYAEQDANARAEMMDTLEEQCYH